MKADEARAINGLCEAACYAEDDEWATPAAADRLDDALEAYRAAGSPRVPDGMSVKMLECPKCSIQLAVMGTCPCEPSGLGDKVFCAESLNPLPSAEALDVCARIIEIHACGLHPVVDDSGIAWRKRACGEVASLLRSLRGET